MEKKHPTKKQTTKKHLTKSRVKANIIAISATGILVGVTAITLGVYFGVTSCKSNPTPTPPGPGPIPPDAQVISSNIDSKYIVQSNENIIIDDNHQLNNHNKFLDLASYVSDEGINTSDFIIEGEIDFGILVDFDEDMNLFGDSQSLIKLGDQANPLLYGECYGIIVGSVSRPVSSKCTYSGKMNIDNSVNVFINASSDFASGVYFEETDNANIVINGVFTVSNILGQTYGVCSNASVATSVITSSVAVNGTFRINSNSSSAYGFCFFQENVIDSNIDTDGIFIINAYGEAVVCYFLAVTRSNVTVDVVSTVNGGAGADGVRVSNEVADKSTFNIDGVFMINSSTNAAQGVLLESIISSSISIGGVFTIEGNYIAAIYFSGGISDSNIDISGVFTTNNIGNSGDTLIDFYYHTTSFIKDSVLNINGTFVDNSSTGVTGISFSDMLGVNKINVGAMFALLPPNYNNSVVFYDVSATTTWNPISNPQFFGFKTDVGNLRSKFPSAQYQWNGRQINSSNPSTIADGGLTIFKASTYDNPNYWVDVIQTTMRKSDNITYNQNVFNQAYKDGLNSYISNHSTCPKHIIGWLRDIIYNIPFIKS